MKTKYKYLILILVTVLTSVFVYDYIEENKPVVVNDNLFKTQSDVEEKILNDNNYSISNPKVILNPYKISPLTALVIFKTNDLASVTVTIKGKNDDGDIVHTFVPNKTHYISIYGLYPDYENTVIIKASSEEKVLKIKTDKLPDFIKNSSVFESNYDDFYFTTSDEINGYPVAYDKNGNVRWYLTRPFSYDFTRLENGYILLGSDSLMKDPYYSSGLVEMDLLGKVYFEYKTPGGYYRDVYEKIDGNLILLSNDFSSNTLEDVIVEIDRNTGDVIKKFDFSKLFKGQQDNWLALNSLSYDMKTNSIVTVGSKKNMITNIDYNTGEINWIIAEKIDNEYKKYLLKASDNVEYPINPSSVILLDEDSIAYINSINNEKHLIIYDIDPVERIFKETKNYNLGVCDGTANMDYIGGKFIITLENSIRILSNNELTTIMKTSSSLYSAKTSSIYAGDMYLLGNGSSLGHTGITPTVKDHSVIFHKKDDSVFKTYNLNLSADVNRLVVSGTFKKSDKVQIILDNVLSKKTYDVDIMNGNETASGKMETTTYINKEGIYGKYYIYLKINGVNYKLCKYAMMS
ncbi:MAG: aryl-sulfate sulfotransferase [Bacilli bacterium]|nr:aryl-sulfate sulfotransferase [Bacilli bacterium]